MLAVSTIALWVTLASWGSFRWKRFRALAEGVPVVVVREGKPIEEMLRLERVTLDELLESAREQGIGDLDDVEIALLEPDGKFTFLGRHLGGHAPPERHQA